VDVGALLGQAVGGGVAGAIVTAVVGLSPSSLSIGSKADMTACLLLTQSGHYAVKHSWLGSAVDVRFLVQNDIQQ
jgi:hypothetical protein